MTLTDKRALRRAVREELAKLSHEDKRLFSADIFDHIESLPQVKEASVVALFASLDDEPQTEVIIERLSHHKRVVLPRIEGDEMEFYNISEGTNLRRFARPSRPAGTPAHIHDILCRECVLRSPSFENFTALSQMLYRI